ncbi:MAG: UDP-N-acetylmuramate--L-alanine ligase, partial [Planctomycetota bacterium]
PMNLQGRAIHFMGIGGMGVSVLAELARHEGALVSGCDLYKNDRTEYLASLGVPIAIGHDPGHVSGADIFVHTSAVKPDHPERLAAGRLCASFRRGAFLARLLEGKRVYGVSGTHGKTTTTWLLGQLLTAAGTDPTILLGGLPVGGKTNLRIGASDVAVAELDESDESFLEPRLVLAVVTSAEPDHLDHYKTPAAVAAAYRRFARGVEPSGVLVASADDPGARSVFAAQEGAKVSAGLREDAMLKAVDLDAEGFRQSFLLRDGGRSLGRFDLPLPGAHNVQNALCALAAAHAAAAPWEALRAALGRCTGVARRFELVGERRGVRVIEDYAHHPTEIAAALRAARGVHAGRVIALFQPHLYSRTQFFCDAFGEALSAADEVLLVDIYPAREEPLPGVTAKIVVEAVRQRNAAVSGPYARDEAAGVLARRVKEGDLVIVLGAGDVGACAHELVERL